MLTDTAIRNAKFKGKAFKMYDEKGLYVLINQAGKYFRLDYRAGGKRKTLALGVYPEVKLKEAREKRDQARKQLQSDIDPAETRKAKKTADIQATETFEAIGREWHSRFTPTWSEKHAADIIHRLEIYIFPWLEGRPIREIAAPELLAVLRRMEAKGTIETAHRMHQTCGQVFRYAVATGRAERDPSGDLRGAIRPAQRKHMAAITETNEVGGLIRAIRDYKRVLKQFEKYHTKSMRCGKKCQIRILDATD